MGRIRIDSDRALRAFFLHLQEDAALICEKQISTPIADKCMAEGYRSPQELSSKAVVMSSARRYGKNTIKTVIKDLGQCYDEVSAESTAKALENVDKYYETGKKLYGLRFKNGDRMFELEDIARIFYMGAEKDSLGCIGLRDPERLIKAINSDIDYIKEEFKKPNTHKAWLLHRIVADSKFSDMQKSGENYVERLMQGKPIS